MSNEARQCPVCRKTVAPTKGGNIGGHLDKAGHPCPASYDLPYRLTIQTSKRRHP